jgi:hypothetical protein
MDPFPVVGAVARYPLINIILSRTFLDAICGPMLVLASQDSTCFNVTECFIVDSRTSMSSEARADLLHPRVFTEANLRLQPHERFGLDVHAWRSRWSR